VGSRLIDELLASALDAQVLDIRAGAFWSAVLVEGPQGRRCGLASNLHLGGQRHADGPSVADAGSLLERSGRELATLARSNSLVEASIGLAALNALLPPLEVTVECNAEEVIAEHGAGKHVVLVGGFPFVPRLRERVGKLSVLELEPREDELPASAAAREIPTAEVVAITGTALLNHTFEGLIELCPPEALVVVLGPSTPLSPLLFERGVDVLAGSIVEDAQSVLRAVSQGATFQQIRKRGVRLVTTQREA
jgi:uncharacterized protein (DUF4213/DUF364 family)